MGKEADFSCLYLPMSFRPFIATLFWPTYALLLSNDLLPHHHHEGTKSHLGCTYHHDAHPDTDGDEQDWWFTHQNSPGVISFQADASTVHLATVVGHRIPDCRLYGQPFCKPKLFVWRIIDTWVVHCRHVFLAVQKSPPLIINNRHLVIHNESECVFIE